MVSNEHKIYIIGGTDGMHYFNEMFEFDTEINKFKEKASMHQFRCYLSCVLLDKYD